MEIHDFSYEHNGSVVRWDVKDIWKAVENSKVINKAINDFKKLTDKVFRDYDKSDKDRVKDADLSYPIIISKDHKLIIDGYHRLFKHMLLGHKLVPCKVIDKMPKPIYCSGTPFKIPGLKFDWVNSKNQPRSRLL